MAGATAKARTAPAPAEAAQAAEWAAAAEAARAARAAAVYGAVSNAYFAAQGEARARLLTAVQGRALELSWLMYELRRQLQVAAVSGAAAGCYEDSPAVTAGAVCSLLQPPPRRDQAAVLLLQVRLARCALAHRAWPATAAAALAAACHRLRPHAEKECGGAVAAGLALAEASWRQQAAAPTGVEHSTSGGSAVSGRCS